MNQRTIILIIMAVVLIFYLFPSQVQVSVFNELNNPESVDYKSSLFQGGYASTFTLWLTPGDHNLVLSKTGFEEKTVKISNWNNWVKKKSLSFTLPAIQLKESMWAFYDPTKTLQLHPAFKVSGTDVLGQSIQKTVHPHESLTAGYYDVLIDDVHFQQQATFSADTLLVNNEEVTTLILEPNQRFTTISPEEANHVFNFLIDYIDLSTKQLILDNAALPQQFYLGAQKQPISAADMIFLYCLHEVYEQQRETQRVYFAPNTKLFIADNKVQSPQDCYRSGLAGYTPSTVKPFTHEFNVENLPLNKRELKEPIAFTFDIESGRYIWEVISGTKAINPCKDEVTSKGLTNEQQKNCKDANAVAWFSPLQGENEESIPYPWVTGIQGTNEILSYSTKYGIPATHFLLTKEIEVLKEYDPTIIQTYNQLTGNLIEIGSHTNTHTKLGTHPRQFDLNELITSKQLLEKQFNTNIKGIRGPYLSKVMNSLRSHQSAVQETGYRYHSSDGVDDQNYLIRNLPINVYYTADTKITDIPYRAQSQGYVITLDHPWNMQYSEYKTPTDTYLVRNESQADRSRAFILQAISQGYEPMTLSELSQLN